MPRRPSTGRTGKRRGDPRQYSRAVRERAKLLWASGECVSDAEIAERIGCQRQTIVKWRASDPEGWKRARDELAQQKSIAAVRKLGESLGDVVSRQLQTVRGIQSRLIRELTNESLEASSPEAVAHALLKALDVERELAGGVRELHGHLLSPVSREQLQAEVSEYLQERREAQQDADDQEND